MLGTDIAALDSNMPSHAYESVDKGCQIERV